MLKAISSIVIKKDLFEINGKSQPLPENDGTLKGLMSAFYHSLNMSYPKFHKMDNLSKLGVIGVELLKQEHDLESYQDDAIALHFQNASASLDTDWVHQQNINEGKAASPANFVYTLPNIVLGEIAIRNKWYGENLFTLADQFDQDRWMKTNQVLVAQNKAEAVLGGWVEVLEEAFELELYFVAKE
ncbi:3-oxoacyl-ACP synthase [Reichenbachiella ulvae]|uniref:3-oxoacyl-ACP synthase n=1 Tax=Reichenbachiella ulvae TaxID=2980104 RepID=A0ABT3CU02_9BACT|nr:3-oxoacyl-ACP synthase [Reichenbachiella ulvae]MCV9387185.1 3-oxoacyl-ACP synthase [Reichenbachiella ulvae]